jgi:hypothetical protein
MEVVKHFLNNYVVGILQMCNISVDCLIAKNIITIFYKVEEVLQYQ